MSKNKKTKVLLCSPHKGTVGGISRWTSHILNYYDSLSTKLNFELYHFYIPGKAVYNNTSLMKRFLIGIETYIPFLNGLKKKFSSHSYDIAHFTSSASISLIKDIYSVKLAKKYGVKSIVHFRFGRIPELFTKRNWETKLLIKVIEGSNKIIVIDKLSYETLLMEGFKNIELLPNPLSPYVNKIIKDNHDIKKEKRSILFAGHVLKTKGVFELVKACKEISNIKLKMIGYVNDENRKLLLETAGVNNEWLEIVGEKDYESIIKEMLSCEIFVLPTYTEGFPNVILESMACGCTIIASGVGAIPEMLNINSDEPCGICVEPKNIEQLKLSILELLDNEELANKYNNNSKKRVNECYSMPVVWGKIESIWKSCL